MKSSSKPIKRIKKGKRKLKLSEKCLLSVGGQIPLASDALNLDAVEGKVQEDMGWATEEKNERELKALKDLCALSDEECGSLSLESDFQKMWMDSENSNKKEALPETNPNLTIRDSIKICRKSFDAKIDCKPQPRAATAKPRNTRNFIKENVLVIMKRQKSREQGSLFGDVSEKTLVEKNFPDMNVEVSIRGSIELGEKKEVISDNEKAKQNLLAGESFLKLNFNSRTASKEEKMNRTQGAFRGTQRQSEPNAESERACWKRFLPTNFDTKPLDLFRFSKTRSTEKSTGRGRIPGSGTSRQEMVDLIDKLEMASKAATKNSIKVLKRPGRYVEDASLESKVCGEMIEARKDYETGNKLQKQKEGIRETFLLSDLKVGSKDLESQLDIEQKDEKKVETQINVHLRLGSDKEQMKPLVRTPERKIKRFGSRDASRRREDSVEKAYMIRRSSLNLKEVQNLRGLEKPRSDSKNYAPITTYPIDEQQKEISMGHKRRKLQEAGVVMNHVSQNISSQGRPMTAADKGEGSPQRKKNILKILNYFRSYGEVTRSEEGAGKSVLRKLIQSSNQKFESNEGPCRQDMRMKLPDSLGVQVAEPSYKNSRYVKASVIRNHISGGKMEELSMSKNFRETAMGALQKVPNTTFLEAIGRKMN